MPEIPFHNPLVTPDFKRGTRTPRPLGPAGTGYDGRASEDLSAHFPASPQVTTIALGGTTATNDVTTLTITPIAGPSGSQWPNEIGELEISFKTAATETLDAVGAGLEAAATAAQLVTTIADLANYKRVSDFVSIEYDADPEDIIITARNTGIRFTATLTTTGSITSTQSSTGNEDDTLRIGIVAVSDGVDSRHGRKIKTPVAASTADDILGVVWDGPNAAPQEAGYAYRYYKRGKDVLYRSYGSAIAYAEAPVTADAQVYVRKTAGASEVAGAVNDSATTDTQEVYTLTPAAVDDTLYRFEIEVRDFFTNAKVAEGIVEMTSATSTNATLICNGLRTSLADDNDQLDDYVTGSGTATLILTAAAGYKLTISPTAPGVLAGYDEPSTAAASDHILWTGVKFAETTAAAGSAPIIIPR